MSQPAGKLQSSLHFGVFGFAELEDAQKVLPAVLSIQEIECVGLYFGAERPMVFELHTQIPSAVAGFPLSPVSDGFLVILLYEEHPIFTNTRPLNQGGDLA